VVSDGEGEIDERLAAALERVEHALRVQMWDAAKRHRLTPTQLQVLLRLASDPAERRRVGALAAVLDVAHPTVSDAVTVLERKGLVEREQPGHRSTLALSRQGRAVAADLASWQERTRIQLARLPADDKRAALRVVLGMIAGLHREGAITVARMCVTCRFFRRGQHPCSARPHHCALLDTPLGDAELRLDCPDHQPEAA
jgi:DNA-binding MarR family transcriptional regulator